MIKLIQITKFWGSKVAWLLREPAKFICTTTDASLHLPPYFLSELPALHYNNKFPIKMLQP